MRDNESDAGTGGRTKRLVLLPHLNSTQLTMAAERKGQIPTEGKTAVFIVMIMPQSISANIFYSILNSSAI